MSGDFLTLWLFTVNANVQQMLLLKSLIFLFIIIVLFNLPIYKRL